MRLKSAMLVHPIRTPWTGNNLTESLIPRDGWEIAVMGEMIHLRKNGESHTIVALSMLRWAEVDVAAVKSSPIILAPESMLEWLPPSQAQASQKAEVIATTPKRRGRPPKAKV